MTGDDADKYVAKPTKAQWLAKVREMFGAFEIAKTDRGLAVTLGDGRSRITTIRTMDEAKVARMETELLDYAKTPPMSIDRSRTRRQ